MKNPVPPLKFVRNTPILYDVPPESTLPTQNFVEASEKAMPSVVSINSRGSSFFKGGTGSGVIITDDGYIVTNKHVIENSVFVSVQLSDKRRFNAEIIGSDESTDIGLIKIEGENLVPIEFSNSNEVKIGEWVLAVGNPFGLNSTVTAGIVSSKGRNINIIPGEFSIESFIQTDAVVNPGNSGGALVNTEGKLVGINTAILSGSGNYEGYSFAIPSNLIFKVINDLKMYGKVKRAILGVAIRDINSDLAKKMDLAEVKGVIITGISTGSSADKSGLALNDIILEINGISTNSVPELQEQVALFHPGDKIAITYLRKGQKYVLENIQLKGVEDVVFNRDIE